MDKESGSLGEMEDRLRRIKERRKQLERGEIDPVYEPILPHINEVMRYVTKRPIDLIISSN